MAAVRLARVEFDREGFYRVLSVWLFAPTTFGTQPELIELFVQRAIHCRCMPTSVRPRPCRATRLHLIRCPTLVAVGSQDLITPPTLAAELAAGIPGVRLRRVPEAGHGAVWEAPAAFNQLRLNFLDRVGPGS